jgi:hypothetical protein
MIWYEMKYTGVVIYSLHELNEHVTPVSCRAQIADNMCIYYVLLSCFTARRTTLLPLLHHGNLFFFCTDVFLVCHGVRL